MKWEDVGQDVCGDYRGDVSTLGTLSLYPWWTCPGSRPRDLPVPRAGVRDPNPPQYPSRTTVESPVVSRVGLVADRVGTDRSLVGSGVRGAPSLPLHSHLCRYPLMRKGDKSGERSVGDTPWRVRLKVSPAPTRPVFAPRSYEPST